MSKEQRKRRHFSVAYKRKRLACYARCTAAVMSLLALTYSRSTAAADGNVRSDPAQDHRWAVGAVAGFGLYEGTHNGYWIEAFGRAILPISDSSTVLLGAGLFAAGYSHRKQLPFHEADVLEETRDEVLGGGVVARAYFDQQFGNIFGLRAGPVAGLAHLSLDSNICGSDSITAPFVGASAGLVARLSPAFELAAQADLLSFPILRCTNSGEKPGGDPFFDPWPKVYRREALDEDLSLIVALSAAYSF